MGLALIPTPYAHMIEEIAHFFESLAEATDECFEFLAQRIEEAAVEIATEVKLAAEEIETYLLLELLDSDLLDPLAPESEGHASAPYPYHSPWRSEDWDYPGFSMGHIGDPNCRYNALSTHLRCAVNPQGPCEGCKDFDPINS